MMLFFKIRKFIEKLAIFVFKKEIWEPIEDYEGLYEISTYGRVKSLAKEWISGMGRICKKDETFLKKSLNCGGYYKVGLCKNGQVKTFQIASLVWDAFGGGKRDNHILEIDHKNGNKQKDYIWNLQLLNHRENISKGFIQNDKKTSRFTGVHWNKSNNKWKSQIKINKKQESLGYFTDEFKANLTYQKKLRSLNIKERRLSF